MRVLCVMVACFGLTGCFGYGRYAVRTRGVYVQPGYAQPTYVQPAYAQPTYVQPAYAQPTYAQPTYVQPVQSAPPAYTVPQCGGCQQGSVEYCNGCDDNCNGAVDEGCSR